MKLSAENVDKVMKECLFKDDEIEDQNPPEGAIVIKGIVRTFGFHPGRIKEAKPAIASMLRYLPAATSFGATRRRPTWCTCRC